LRKLHGSINKRERLSHSHIFNKIEYLFCERLFGKVLLIKKSTAGKLWKINCDRKTVAKKVQQKNCGRKSVVEKSWQKNYDKKSAVEKVL
jgi:hypothetical protein